MRMVFGLVLVLGLGLAGFAVYMAQDHINSYQAELARERAARAAIVPTKDVYVVNEQVRYGQQLTADMVRVVKWPEDAIPEGIFEDVAVLFPEGQNGYRTVLRTMEKDEAVLVAKVTEPGEDAGVSSRLSKGMRAFAISVDVASGVSGFLRPGDRVDVYWTGQADFGEERGGRNDVTKLIKAGIRLIAIDQTADSDRSAPTIARTVTVEATPNQVAALAQAQSTGRLSLSLVGAEDDTVAGAVEVDQDELLGVQRVKQAEAAQERVCTIRTRRGAEVVEIPIPCTE